MHLSPYMSDSYLEVSTTNAVGDLINFLNQNLN